MTKEEYREKMKALGWSDEYIAEQLRIAAEAAKKGVKIPLNCDLFEAPIEY